MASFQPANYYLQGNKFLIHSSLASGLSRKQCSNFVVLNLSLFDLYTPLKQTNLQSFTFHDTTATKLNYGVVRLCTNVTASVDLSINIENVFACKS